MTKEEMHQDYLTIYGMNAPLPKKAIMLGGLLSCYEETWRVVGITEEALKVFKKHDFKSASKMGINRAHKVHRITTYKEMLSIKMEIESWWAYYIKHDTTILSTSSENRRHVFSKTIIIDEQLGLFKSRGFKWRHGRDEISFLKKEYDNLNL